MPIEIGWEFLEKKIFELHQFIFVISLSSPLGKGQGIQFRQTWIPITKGYFMPSLVEIGPVVLEKKIFNFHQCIFAISLLSPYGKGQGPWFAQTWIPFTYKGCFVPSLVEIGHWFLRRKQKCEKFSTTIMTSTTTMMDNRQISIRKAPLNFQVR